MTGPRSATTLAQTCWCDTHVRHVSPAAVRAGEGWSCCPECQPGCRPGVGQQHGPRRGRPPEGGSVSEARKAETARGSERRSHETTPARTQTPEPLEMDVK